ncbi:MAG: hypothetical protein KF883_08455 [Thermomicrobiales bacterium]|nr:hypothetical protein [Thermomicrobiales bacterium]
MDNSRFDSLTRLLGAGGSRRQVLRGFLGLGGVATAAGQVDARESRTRPTVPPPPDPPVTTTTETTPAPSCPAGEEFCPNSTLCCPDGTCARSGNQAICCTGVVCGLECCESELACCDRECCSIGAVCLDRVFPSSGYEEYCCPDELTCGGGCCAGACYIPAESGATWYDRSCCAAGDPLCPGSGPYAATAACCDGEGRECCTDSLGRPVCLTTEQCCLDAECAALTDPSACLVGVCRDFACTTETVCPSGASCCIGFDNVCCPSGQTCCSRNQEAVICLTDQQCCGDEDCTEFERSYCNLSTNACVCDPLTCDDFPAGQCGEASDGCGGILDCQCDSDEQCCPGVAGALGVCRPELGCCSADDCTEESGACVVASCSSSGVCEYTDCQSSYECCSRWDGEQEVGTCIDPEEQCCNDWECDGYEGCIQCDAQFTCQPANTGEYCSECRVCDAGLCAPGPEGDTCLNLDGPDTFEGTCCEGYCADVESCDECSRLDDDCSDDGDCCSGNCCEGVCIDAWACCENADCFSPCLACSETHTCVFTCQVENTCCWAPAGETCDESLNGGLGACVDCIESGGSCNATSGPGCCEGDFCVGGRCQDCLPVNGRGCGDDDDCCAGVCRSSFCICFDERQGSCYLDQHCCGNLVCADTGESNHNGYCLQSCIAGGNACGSGIGFDCCHGHRCSSTDGGQSFSCRAY